MPLPTRNMAKSLVKLLQLWANKSYDLQVRVVSHKMEIGEGLKDLTSSVYTVVFMDSKYSRITSIGKCVVPMGIISIGLP